MRSVCAIALGVFLCSVSPSAVQAQMLTGYGAATPASAVPTKIASARPLRLTDPDVQVFSLDDATPAPKALASVPEITVAPPPAVMTEPALRSQGLLTAPDPVEVESAVAAEPSAVVASAATASANEIGEGSYAAARALRAEQPVIAAASTTVTPDAGTGGNEPPVDFEADNLQHDEATRTITATGNVQLVQAGKILRAQRMVYNLAADTVKAEGNVILSDTNGDIHFAEELELTGQMREGAVRKLQTYLGQGGRFTAASGKKMGNGDLRLTEAAYTPCDCENDEDGDPAWQIKAKEVNYDKEGGRISYKHAKFEIYGVPVMYTPYLSHSDGREKQKSGFLTPGFGFNSQLGYQLTNQYYWAVGSDRDATMGVMLTTKKNPVGLLEYRQRFANAELTLNGSATSSERKDQVGGEEVTRGEEARGHLFAHGLWNINNKWRSGVNLELTSDDQYLRQYDFGSKDVLENQLYVERFSGRNYAVGRVLAFQDVRVDEERRDQPDVLPEVLASFTGEPNRMLGGRWHVEASALGLRRGGDGQDVNRGVLTAGWQRKLVSQTGLVSTIDISARGDIYDIHDRDLADADPALDNEGSETRFFPQAHVVTSYPMGRSFETMQVMLEPVAALTVAPNINNEEGIIPNEDSEDAQIDALNIFNPSRFPGKDRIDDRSRVTYGMRSGFYGYGGSYLDMFAGQSYRFDEDDNPFPEGSGLDSQESDFVGQVSGMYDNRFSLNYRFQLAADDLSSQRHEFDGYGRWSRFALTSRYLYATSLENTSIEESREQVEGIASVDLSKRWRFNTGALYDLGEDPGLRKAAAGVDFVGCCMSFSLLAERNYTTDSSGDNGTDIKFRIGLDHLGLIETGASDYWNNRSMTADD